MKQCTKQTISELETSSQLPVFVVIVLVLTKKILT